MKKYLLTFFLLVSFNFNYGQDTIYSIAYTGPCPFGTADCTYDFDDHDTAHHFFIDTNQTNNIWEIGIPSKSIFDSAYSLPFALSSSLIPDLSFILTLLSPRLHSIWGLLGFCLFDFLRSVIAS